MKIPFNPNLDVIPIRDLKNLKDDFIVQTCTEQAPGAWPNGSRVVKNRDDQGDTHKIGDKAVVVGSIGPAEWQGIMTYGYFVNWDDMPGVPVMIISQKLKLEE